MIVFFIVIQFVKLSLYKINVKINRILENKKALMIRVLL